MAHGAWSPDAGPPYVKHITMWSDSRCVDHTGPANNVRRILGLRTSWHGHKWNTNSYMSEMNSVQLRFLSRNSNRSTRAFYLYIYNREHILLIGRTHSTFLLEITFFSRNSNRSSRAFY
jgi:hypothetical protein